MLSFAQHSRRGCAACGLPRFVVHLDLWKQMVPSGYKNPLLLSAAVVQERKRLQFEGWEPGRDTSAGCTRRGA